MNIKKVLIGIIAILFIIIFTCIFITFKNNKKIDIENNIEESFETTPPLEENLEIENNSVEIETTDTVVQEQITETSEVQEQQGVQETSKQVKTSVSSSENTSTTNKNTSQVSAPNSQVSQNKTTTKSQVETQTTIPTQTQEQPKSTQENTEVVTPPSTETKVETINEEKYIRNDAMITKIKSVINNNPSEYMKTYGYNIVVDSSIKEHCNQFTFTENRVKSYVTYKFGTIRIYAEDYYRNGQLIMTECYIY